MKRRISLSLCLPKKNEKVELEQKKLNFFFALRWLPIVLMMQRKSAPERSERRKNKINKLSYLEKVKVGRVEYHPPRASKSVAKPTFQTHHRVQRPNPLSIKSN
jgi:hypothetical protein